MARQAGANIIKIIQHKTPDKWSSCHRLKAKIYKVTNPKLHETKIEWSLERKLTWEDFKGVPNLKENPDTLALTSSGFGYETGVGMFKKGEIFVQSVFYTNQSWFVPEGETDYVLRHEQIHFDITEIFSRKLRKELVEAKVTSTNFITAKPIFDRVFNEMRNRQKRYDQETVRGEKKETQEYWEAIIELELAKYEFYKSN